MRATTHIAEGPSLLKKSPQSSSVRGEHSFLSKEYSELIAEGKDPYCPKNEYITQKEPKEELAAPLLDTDAAPSHAF